MGKYWLCASLFGIWTAWSHQPMSECNDEWRMTVALASLKGRPTPSPTGLTVVPLQNGFMSNLQCEAPKIAKLVYNSNVTMVYGISNELVTGANLNQQTYRTGASHMSPRSIFLEMWILTTRIHMDKFSSWIVFDHRGIYLTMYTYIYIYIYIYWSYKISHMR